MVENRRYGHVLMWIAVLLCFFSVISAWPINKVEASNQINVKLDGKLLEVPSNVTTIKDGRVFVPLRLIAEEMGIQLQWIGANDKVILTDTNSKVELTIHSLAYKVNGQTEYSDVAPFIQNKRTVVPLRFLAKGMDLGVRWDPSSRTVLLSSSGIGDQRFLESRSRATYTNDQLYWLAKIIHAESRGEPILGQVAVGAVILNRVDSPTFPNTIYTVIFEKWGAYYQFEPVQNGSIHYLEPNATAYEAARRALVGEDPTKGTLYFHNPNTSKSAWMASKQVAVRIGNHDFLY